jgi:hypothetical protein
MLARFICPVAKLTELQTYAPILGAQKPLAVTALGRGGTTVDDFTKALNEDMAKTNRFRQEMRSSANVEVFEARVPHGTSLRATTHPEYSIFFETTPGEQWKQRISDAVLDLAGQSRLGFKLRTGGVTASAFPTSEQIAFTIAQCRDKQVPLKFTAGLHHPIRHFNQSVDTKMHGFINVFAAGVLAHTSGLTEQQIERILEDEEAGDFVFTDDSLRWRDVRAATDQIASIRQKYLISFGSCSFDEPRDDLRAMDWL